ncbi:hypothetical protein [Vibrio vulnificus]|uniref:hypothetical protein n=1 Tax=Vibrio vulnificus TaxID=672 RepID=UPI00159414EA|nr:hypothetical protein [Vibrio vulnificus]NVC72612.1 hypothetical protein [Vibrio vulnificus]
MTNEQVQPDIFDVSGLEITNPEQDLSTPANVEQESYDDFAAMWANENKEDAPNQSLGLEEAQYDENGHEIEGEEVEYEGADEELEAHADEVAERNLAEAMEQYQGFANSFNELPDDLAFNVNGVELTKADLVAVAHHNETVKNSFGHIIELQRDLKGAVDAMQYQIQAAQTETAKEKQAIKAQLNSPAIPQMEKVGLYEKLQNLEQRDQFLTNSARQFSARNQAAQKQALEARVSAVSSQLQMKYAPEQINSTISYAIDSGIPQNEVFELSSVPFFEMMAKAKAYDELKGQSLAKAQPKKATKSVKRPSRKQAVSKVSNADALINAWQSGNTQNPQAIEDAIFANLID